MNKKEVSSKLSTQTNYTKTDIQHYNTLTGGQIKVALTTKALEYLYPLFTLISDKDSSVASEIETRASSLENRFFSSSLDDKYNKSIEQIISASIEAKLFGVAIVELFLDSTGDFAFEKVNQEYIFIEEGGEIFLKTGNKKFKPTEPKFFIIKHEPLLIKLLWIVYAKHFVLSHFMKFTEFLGVPPLIVNASSSDSKTIDEISDALRELKSASYGVFGSGDIVKVLEGRGSQDDFLAFVKYADAEIAKVINGQSLSSNASSHASYALGKVQESVRLEIVAKDVKFATTFVNKLFEVLELKSELTIFIEKDTDLLNRANTLKLLFDMGYEMNEEDISKEFDLKLQKRSTQPNHRLQANAKDKILPIDKFDKFFTGDKFKDSLKANEMEIKESLEKVLLSATTFEEAFELLNDAYPDMALDKLEEMFTTVLFNSQLHGYIEED